MPDQKVRWLDVGAVQQVVQFHGYVRGGSRSAAGAAPTQSGAVVRCGARKVRYDLLNVKPVQIGGGDAGLEEHGGGGRFRRALLKQIELVAAPDRHPAPRSGEAPPVTAAANPLIQEAHTDQSAY